MAGGVILSDKAAAICETNYIKNCGGCPLRKACVVRIGPGQDALDRWVAGINEAAEEVEEN